MSRALACALAMALAGCGPTWVHQTKSADDFEADLYGCERDAAAQRDVILWRTMMERCLRVQGWRAQ